MQSYSDKEPNYTFKEHHGAHENNQSNLVKSYFWYEILPSFPKDLPSFRLRVFPKDLPSFALFYPPLGEKSRRDAQVGLRILKMRNPTVEGLRFF